MKQIYRHQELYALCFAALFLTANLCFAQCTAGDEKIVTIPCYTGLLTSPGVVQCPGPVFHDWYLKEASIGSASSGQGGIILVTPESTISDVERSSINRYLLEQLKSVVNKDDFNKTEQLASLIKSVAGRQLPLHGAITASARVSLQSNGISTFCVGRSTSECPHMFVPSLPIKLICLPKLPLD